MKRLSFESLNDSMQFQQLCAELLRLEGCKNIRGLGTGADQGSDIIVEVPITSPFGVDLQCFIVQCKWYKSNNSVGQDEVIANFEYLDLHDATGLLFITSSQFSGTAITKMNAIDKSTRNPYHIKFWDGYELTRRLRKHPELITRFWYPQENLQNQDLEQMPVYDEQAFLAEFARSLPEFASITVDTFPITSDNEQFVEHLKQYAEEFAKHPPVITIVEGGTGTGKTGYSWSLLNQKLSEGYRVAELQPFDFSMSFVDFALHGHDHFLVMLKFFREVDFLLVDNIERSGLFLDKSDTQIRAAQSLVTLIQERVAANRPTLLSMTAVEQIPGETIRNYLQHLKAHHLVVYTGNVSLRPSMRRDVLEVPVAHEEKNVQEVFTQETFIIAEICSLLYKFNNIETQLGRVVDILQTPEDEDESKRQRWKEISGDYQSRSGEMLEQLQDAKDRLGEIMDFVLSYYPDKMVKTARHYSELSSLNYLTLKSEGTGSKT